MGIFKVKRLMNIKKIVLFGSTGMVGSNIVNHEKFKEYDFVCPSRREIDLMQTNLLGKYLAKIKPDLVINVAGMVGGIVKNSKNNYEFLLNNSMININLIHQSYKLGIKNFLNVSSSCIYPKNNKSPITEESIFSGPLEPTNEGYAISKLSALKMCNYLFNDKNLNYKTLIPCNLYGPFDNFDPEGSHMIPGVIKRIHYSKTNNINSAEIWGDGLARREFMFVGDFVNLIFSSIESFEKLPALINIGLGEDYEINHYYNVISKVIGYEGNFTHDLDKPVGMKRKMVDISKMKQLGWQHKTSLEEGIKKTYEYYLKHYEGQI